MAVKPNAKLAGKSPLSPAVRRAEREAAETKAAVRQIVRNATYTSNPVHQDIYKRRKAGVTPYLLAIEHQMTATKVEKIAAKMATLMGRRRVGRPRKNGT